MVKNANGRQPTGFSRTQFTFSHPPGEPHSSQRSAAWPARGNQRRHYPHMTSPTQDDRPIPNSYWVRPGKFRGRRVSGRHLPFECQGKAEQPTRCRRQPLHRSDGGRGAGFVRRDRAEGSRQAIAFVRLGASPPSSTGPLPTGRGWSRFWTRSTPQWSGARRSTFTAGEELGAPAPLLDAGFVAVGTRGRRRSHRLRRGGREWRNVIAGRIRRRLPRSDSTSWSGPSSGRWTVCNEPANDERPLPWLPARPRGVRCPRHNARVRGARNLRANRRHGGRRALRLEARPVDGRHVDGALPGGQPAGARRLQPTGPDAAIRAVVARGLHVLDGSHI